MAHRLSGTKNNPVDLVDLTSDDDFDLSVRDHVSIKREPDSIIVPDDDDDGEQNVEDVGTPEPHNDDSDDVIALTEAQWQDGVARLAQRSTSSDVPRFHTQVQSATTRGGLKLEVGMSVEFDDKDFLRIRYIYKHNFSQEVLLKGDLLRRFKPAVLFPWTLNELCIFMQPNSGSTEPMAGTSLVCRPASEVRRVREVIFTNLPFPACSFRGDMKWYTQDPSDQQWKPNALVVREQAVLVCRWKLVEYWNVAKKKVEQRDIKQLRQSEGDPGKTQLETVKRRNFFRQHNKQEVSTGLKRHFESIDISSDDEPEEVTTKVRKTFITDTFKQTKNGSFHSRHRESVSIESSKIKAKPRKLPNSMRSGGVAPRSTLSGPREWIGGDICAGAGGMSRGMELGGLKVNFLLDRDADRCKTLRRNWKREYVVEMDITTFVGKLVKGKLSLQVDVLHLSLPCKFWSPAHTRAGKEDQGNHDILFSVQEILEYCRPRIVTFEQTSGLRTHHPFYFVAFIRIITSLNYSLTEKIINCAEVGNAQPRPRLCIIASCPGQRTPPLPKPTHGNGPGLKPFVTIADCLNKVRGPLEPHMMAATDQRDKNYLPFNPNQPLRNAITCNGGKDNRHPNGERSFNIQELALLQGFPAYHKFAPLGMTTLREQVGDACPAESLGKAIFASVKKTLDETEAEAALEDAPVVLD